MQLQVTGRRGPNINYSPAYKLCAYLGPLNYDQAKDFIDYQHKRPPANLDYTYTTNTNRTEVEIVRFTNLLLEHHSVSFVPNVVILPKSSNVSNPPNEDLKIVVTSTQGGNFQIAVTCKTFTRTVVKPFELVGETVAFFASGYRQSLL